MHKRIDNRLTKAEARAPKVHPQTMTAAALVNLLQRAERGDCLSPGERALLAELSAAMDAREEDRVSTAQLKRRLDGLTQNDEVCQCPPPFGIIVEDEDPEKPNLRFGPRRDIDRTDPCPQCAKQRLHLIIQRVQIPWPRRSDDDAAYQD